MRDDTVRAPARVPGLGFPGDPEGLSLDPRVLQLFRSLGAGIEAHVEEPEPAEAPAAAGAREERREEPPAEARQAKIQTNSTVCLIVLCCLTRTFGVSMEEACIAHLIEKSFTHTLLLILVMETCPRYRLKNFRKWFAYQVSTYDIFMGGYQYVLIIIIA